MKKQSDEEKLKYAAHWLSIQSGEYYGRTRHTVKELADFLRDFAEKMQKKKSRTDAKIKKLRNDNKLYRDLLKESIPFIGWGGDYKI